MARAADLEEARGALPGLAARPVDDPQARRWVHALLVEGTPDDWAALARAGAHDHVAAALPGAIGPDEPLARAALGVLARGFFAPRPGRLGLDLARARGALVGGEGLPALSSGALDEDRPEGPWAHPVFGPLQPFHAAARTGRVVPAPPARGALPGTWRWGHVQLSRPVLHPVACHRWALALGWRPEVAAALLDGEVYLEVDGSPALWPWYREQDAALRASAASRGAALGVPLPPRFLDEPYESAWYLRRAGLAALMQAVRAAGLADLEAATIDVVPAPPLRERPPIREVGGVVPGRVSQALSRLVEYATLAARGEAPEVDQALRRALTVVVAELGGEVSPPAREREVPILSGAPPRPAHLATASAPDRFSTLLGVWAAEGGLVLAYPRLLVALTGEGRVRGTWTYHGELRFAGGRAALVEGEAGWHALDLATGTWLSGPARADTWFGGPLWAARDDETPGYGDRSWALARRSPDARYLWYAGEERPIVRLEDGSVVSEPAPFGEDEGEEPRGRPLIGPRALAEPDARVYVIDGARFTVLRATEHAVAGAGPPAFALGPRGFRALRRGQLLEGARRVARIGAPAHTGAFTPEGQTLWALGPSHLHRISWEEQPRHVGSLSLARLAGLFRVDPAGALQAAERAALLDHFGDVAGVAAASVEALVAASGASPEALARAREACAAAPAVVLSAIAREEAR